MTLERSESRESVPVVSIVLPVYNVEDSVRAIITKVLSLSYPSTQVIVVDDGSTDGTFDSFLRYAPDSWRIRHLTKNGGPGVARNSGIVEATGEYLWFPDWDDDWKPHILDTLVVAAQSTNSDLAVVAAERVAESGTVEERIDFPRTRTTLNPQAAVIAFLEGRIRGYVWNKLFRRSQIPTNWFPSVRIREDEIAVARFIGSARGTVLVDESLYTYKSRPDSVTRLESSTAEILQSCYQTALRISSNAHRNKGLVRAMDVYRYRTLVLPLAALSVGVNGSRADVPSYRRAKSQVRIRDVLGMVALDRKIALKLAILKCSPLVVYRRLLVARRVRR